MKGLLLKAVCSSAVVVVMAGCSGGAPYSTTPVSGKVTYEDGSLIPAQTITLTFDSMAEAVDEKTHPRKGSCSVDISDGTIDEATTYKFGDGVIAGKHKVTVVALGAGGELLVPKEYTSARDTPLEVDTDDFPLEIKIPKPTGSPAVSARPASGA